MWTAAALWRNRTSLGGTIWRAVEAQHHSSTRRIVNTAAEQTRLETLLEATKPTYPPGTERLDYLLASPFRYGNPNGSRFRSGGQRWGVFYAGGTVRVALSELAYHRLRFFLASEGTPLPQQAATLTVFSAHYETNAGIDLSRRPFDAQRAHWTDPDDYSHTQVLGVQAVAAGIAALKYYSARSPEPDYCVGIFDPWAFTLARPDVRQTWHLYLGASEVTATRAMAGAGEQHAFSRSTWRL